MFTLQTLRALLANIAPSGKVRSHTKRGPGRMPHNRRK